MIPSLLVRKWCHVAARCCCQFSSVGSSHFSGRPASVLQKAAVRIIDSTVCKSLMSDEVTEGMLCAGVLKGGVDACQVIVPQNNRLSTLSTLVTCSSCRGTLAGLSPSPAPVGGPSWLAWSAGVMAAPGGTSLASTLAPPNTAAGSRSRAGCSRTGPPANEDGGGGQPGQLFTGFLLTIAFFNLTWFKHVS